MKFLVLPGYPQAEIESGFSDRYLATSTSKSWVYNGEGDFQRVDASELGTANAGREDL